MTEGRGGPASMATGGITHEGASLGAGDREREGVCAKHWFLAPDWGNHLRRPGQDQGYHALVSDSGREEEESAHQDKAPCRTRVRGRKVWVSEGEESLGELSTAVAGMDHLLE